MRVAIASPDDGAVGAVRQLLFPWHVEYVSPERADVVVAYKAVEDFGKATVFVPSEAVEFHKWFEGFGVKAVEVGGGLRVPVTDGLALNLTPQTGRLYVKLTDGLGLKDDLPLGVWVGGGAVLLSVDIFEEYALRFGEMLNPRVSPLFRFLVGLPVPYTWAPGGFRNLFFGAGKVNCDDSLLDHLALDALRYLLVWGVQEATGKRLLRRTWKGRRYVCCVTHDVDTGEGFRRALALKGLEERYDVASAWFLPTERFKLDSGVVLGLANHGEVGAHDTRHDGRLLGLSRERVVRRLGEAKRTLEGILGCGVVGFRAPLLQHSAEIFGGLLEAGYAYDSSVPCWEPRHPSFMGPYGIDTVYPLDVGGIVEFPVSVPQDHQMIQVLGLNAKQTVEKWLEMKETIKELGGIYTILVHPDYELASPEGIGAYEELLSALTSDNQVGIILPRELASEEVINRH